MSPSILVTHPGLQHSHQLAMALHERKLLKSFWSGVPVVTPGELPPWWLPPSYKKKVRSIGIPATLRRHPLRFQVALQLARSDPSPTSSDVVHRIFHWFDEWAAQRIMTTRPKVVVAYENAAYRTFQAAQTIGAKCILDAAAFHHKTAAEQINLKPTPYTAEINRRKDEEVKMADLILTCSPLAGESYIANGVPRWKVGPLLLGAELPSKLPYWQPQPGIPRFVFAGTLCHRKSVDLILDAFQWLHTDGLEYDLQFIGGSADPRLLNIIRSMPNVSYTPGLTQPELYKVLSQSDCLLLPSRSDAFGMVVAESMICGTPAIVSTQTGSKAMIEDYPGSGWIVEPTADDIYRQVRKLIEHPEFMHAARPMARKAGQAFSWANYRSRAGQLLEEFVQ
jgi:glycosyltransferase involved in cell wall biosynthesis